MTEQGDPPPATPIAVNLAVVVGNGFTLDCASQLGLHGIDISNPVDWPIVIPGQQELTVREALPSFFRAFDELRRQQPRAHQFELLRAILGVKDVEEGRAEVEARHYLALAYRTLTSILASGPVEHWRWLQWFQAYAHVLVTTVSFNYDCLLELVLSRTGRQYHRMHNVARGIVRVFKPHGSADFDLAGIVRGPLSYPLRVYARMNNCPLRIVPADEWGSPPSEPLIVLPYEENPYARYQWVAPGYSNYARIGAGLTHCVFIGLSYHPADRPEIDHFLYSTPKSCRIVIANQAPPTEFIAAVRSSGRELFLWTDGPQPLPIG